MTLIEERVKIILPDFLKYLDVLEEEKNVPEKEIKLKDGKSIIIYPEKNNIACINILCYVLVGTRGFEPPTTCTPCKCATRLRYVPN